MDFLNELRKDRGIDVIFWRKHPELKKQLVDDAYPDKAHFVHELLQNSEDAGAIHAWCYIESELSSFTMAASNLLKKM